jgi:hypothetical protein
MKEREGGERDKRVWKTVTGKEYIHVHCACISTHVTCHFSHTAQIDSCEAVTYPC